MEAKAAVRGRAGRGVSLLLAQRVLRRRGRVPVEAVVKFKSTNGASTTKHRKIKLVRR